MVVSERGSSMEGLAIVGRGGGDGIGVWETAREKGLERVRDKERMMTDEKMVRNVKTQEIVQKPAFLGFDLD